MTYSFSLHHSSPMPPPELNWALFFDIDGTLADLMPSPEMVRIQAHALQSLHQLHQALDGALALISGRTLASIDLLMFPHCFPAAGQHGLERRNGRGAVTALSSQRALMESLADQVAEFHRHFPQLFIEYKGLSVAVHYRQAPSLERLVKSHLRPLAEAHRDDVALLEGKMVCELKLKAADKGSSIAAFLQEAPFRGRMPVFIGDDVTDEAGFKAVNALSGISVKIGGGPTHAALTLESIELLHSWLSLHAGPLLAARRSQERRPS